MMNCTICGANDFKLIDIDTPSFFYQCRNCKHEFELVVFEDNIESEIK